MSANIKNITFVQIFDGMRFLLGLIASFLIIALFGCSTDFDINAQKKDITVVYGLLSQNDSTQYVKVSKAFLGDISAYEMAQDQSFSSYGDDIDVKVFETTNGNVSRTFYLQKKMLSDLNLVKDSGIFYFPDQEVYFFKPNPLLNVVSTYKIVIKNNKTQQESTSTTGLVNTFSIQLPAYPPATPPNPFPFFGLVNQNDDYDTYDVKWKSAKNGRVYQPYFRFHYREVDKTTLVSTDKIVDWYLGSVKSTDLNGGELLQTNYKSDGFFKHLQAVIPINYNVDRIIGNLEFNIAVGGDDLSVYIDLNKPSSSIIEERPAYTNIAPADISVGIFSCRYTKKMIYNLNPATTTKLISGEYTVNLGFKQ